MTDEELDLLASAYVDGEATPDEVAMVERDPDLQARVELFRSVKVDGSPAPPPGLVDRHLAAALAEFEAVAPSPTGEPSEPAGGAAPVVDLRARRAERRPTMPSWLPVAAGFVIVGGGLIWAIGQTGGGGDDAEAGSDTAAADFADEATAESPDAGEEEAAEEAEMATAMADEAMDGGDATEEDAMEADADDAAEGDAARSTTSGPEGTDDAAESGDGTADDRGEPTPVLFFDEIPDPDTIEDLPDPEPDLERSLCGAEIVTATLGEPIGFIPIEIQGRPAELFVFLDGDGTEIRVLVDDDCQPLEP